jgi:hypothetical protein
MVNGAVLVPFDPGDFGFERGNALVELRHRQGVEILSGELRQRIIAAARKILIGIHEGER